MSPDGFIGAGDGLRTWRGTRDRLSQISMATLVIYGDLDAPMLVKAGEHMAKVIPGATHGIIPQAAHCPQEERPDLFNAALRRHLECNAGTASAAAPRDARG
jgi:pimeloyl-ACP methyl ester carboxylesterase